jgi:cytochrome b
MQADRRIHVWDLPLRIFHWALALAVTVAIVTGKAGGTWMEIHGKAGLAIIGLVVFRVVWGFVGSTHARFRNFAPSWSRLRDYAKGKWQGLGHNPLGALSVFALLTLLALQAGSGLFSSDDIAFTGPFHATLDASLAGRITGFHHTLANVLLALTALHVAAIAFYAAVRKKDLVKPMLTGQKNVPAAQAATVHEAKANGLALVAALLVAVASTYAASGAGLETPRTVQTASGKSAW